MFLCLRMVSRHGFEGFLDSLFGASEWYLWLFFVVRSCNFAVLSQSSRARCTPLFLYALKVFFLRLKYLNDVTSTVYICYSSYMRPQSGQYVCLLRDGASMCI